ncbi:DUF6146 family protein [uncultured Flavobacterium sp.]|uniref:DUF6146 family protein n=1 Tax=uncultured Flavobacterium sp. TaxID=165435 RepID=UPI0030ED82C3|tara:strand:+ start:30259 stop:30687 length:429 start_codon:yes stop_codon:yes gene_type:complete
MKTYISIFALVFIMLFSCTSSKEIISNDKPLLESDTIRIANDEIEYEVLIIDGGFTSWFNSRAKPRNFYTQDYLEARNHFWVLEWNRRANMPTVYNSNLYEIPINYETNIDYGFEVNYMIFNYLTYFQLTNKQQLGGFPARL